MDDNGVAVLAWCPNCALPVRVDHVATYVSRGRVCDGSGPAARDRGKPEEQAPNSTRSIEDLV